MNSSKFSDFLCFLNFQKKNIAATYIVMSFGHFDGGFVIKKNTRIRISPYWAFKFCHWICNQHPQKSQNTNFYYFATIFKIVNNFLAINKPLRTSLLKIKKKILNFVIFIRFSQKNYVLELYKRSAFIKNVFKNLLNAKKSIIRFR